MMNKTCKNQKPFLGHRAIFFAIIQKPMKKLFWEARKPGWCFRFGIQKTITARPV